MSNTGIAVDFMPTPMPDSIFVAAPVVDALAISFTEEKLEEV
ncbi:MAG: hypothetical protein BWY88_00719 [Synergistetes bacterium ADurb.Bin520]|nr:MAG: hypothetical protein BWY88_00719 [Synergistetes bacterium ADurb.Bin520]